MNYVTVAAAFFFCMDQLSKRSIEKRFADRSLSVGGLLQIRLHTSRKRHYRSAATRRAMIAIWITAFAAAVILVTATPTFDNRVTLIALGAALGGAAGNLRDVLASQSIRDFINTGWWPAFNVADMAIVCGLVVAFFPH